MPKNRKKRRNSPGSDGRTIHQNADVIIKAPAAVGPHRLRPDNNVLEQLSLSDPFSLLGESLVPGTKPFSPQEIIEMQSGLLSEAKGEVQKHQIATSTIAHICIGLAFLAQKGYAPLVNEDGQLLIRKKLIEDVHGLSLTLTETSDGDVLLGLTERGDQDVNWEGRSV